MVGKGTLSIDKVVLSVNEDNEPVVCIEGIKAEGQFAEIYLQMVQASAKGAVQAQQAKREEQRK